MTKSNWTANVLVPILSLLVALTSVITAYKTQSEQTKTSLVTADLQVKYNEKRKAYSKFLSIASKSYFEIKNANSQNLLDGIATLYEQYYLLEPLFEDDFVYIYRSLMTSSNIPDTFSREKYYEKSKFPSEFRCTDCKENSYPLGCLIVNLGGIVSNYDLTKEKDKKKAEEYIERNLEEIIAFFTTEVRYKLFIEE